MQPDRKQEQIHDDNEIGELSEKRKRLNGISYGKNKE